MPFTEFCCRSGGSNLNAGTRTGNSTEPGTAADFTYASGNWVAATGVFTVASGNPSTDGVAVGDFASVYADGSTVTGFVGRVTARDTTTITVSLTAKAGTAPTDGTGNRTLRIGGAWLGPNGTSGFPMNFVTNTLTNASGDFPRVNYKSDQTMSITANISTVNADTTHQGYTTSYGDLGKAILRGPTTGAAFNLIGTTVGANASLIDFDCAQNGATGSSGGVFWNGTGQVVRCVFHVVFPDLIQTHRNHEWCLCQFQLPSMMPRSAPLVVPSWFRSVGPALFHPPSKMPRSAPFTRPSPFRSLGLETGASQPDASSTANDCVTTALLGHNFHVLARPKVLESPESSNIDDASTLVVRSWRSRHTSSALIFPPL